MQSLTFLKHRGIKYKTPCQFTCGTTGQLIAFGTIHTIHQRTQKQMINGSNRQTAWFFIYFFTTPMCISFCACAFLRSWSDAKMSLLDGAPPLYAKYWFGRRLRHYIITQPWTDTNPLCVHTLGWIANICRCCRRVRAYLYIRLHTGGIISRRVSVASLMHIFLLLIFRPVAWTGKTADSGSVNFSICPQTSRKPQSKQRKRAMRVRLDWLNMLMNAANLVRQVYTRPCWFFHFKNQEFGEWKLRFYFYWLVQTMIMDI